MGRETGTVKWFSKEKGYGFIHRSSGGDIFVHHSDIEGDGFRTLRQGESVDYEVKVADKGPRATLVRKQDAPSRRNGGRKAAQAGVTPATEATGPTGHPPAGESDRTLSAQIKRKIGRFFSGN